MLAKNIVVSKRLPDVSDVHVNQPLSNLSLASIQEQRRFAATRAFPVVPSRQKSNTYYIWNSDAINSTRGVTKVAPGVGTSTGGVPLSTATFNCIPYGTHEDVTMELAENADEVLQLERTFTEVVTVRHLINLELNFATNYFTTGIWGTDAAVTNAWTDKTNGDPIGDIDTGKGVIEKAIYQEPNTLVVNVATHRALARHPDLLDKYKHTQAGILTPELIAAALEIENYVVSRATYNSAVEGATAVGAYLLTNNALLCYVAPNPGRNVMSAGYHFMQDAFSNGMGGPVISTFPIREQRVTSRVEGILSVDSKVITAAAGYLMTGVS